MSKVERYTHEFVEFIPDALLPGVLYVSTTYATTAHLCMCGCGFEVNSPISPQQWCVIFDGRTVSLSPSIGNWSFECQSHYWLDRGRVDWAATWSRERIAAGRAATVRRMENAARAPHNPDPDQTSKSKQGWIYRLWAARRR
ncbi:DUF6527 family protein [Aeromicrobium sp. NPDC092404]|uniref:DUF6527 family protein n=1 Tax=Aeromicrobium sp. NPDC092404 TaxID=3154976 RepID=UPI003445A681